MRRHKYLFSVPKTHSPLNRYYIDIDLLETTVGYSYQSKKYDAGDVFEVTEGEKVFHAMLCTCDHKEDGRRTNLMVILNDEGLKRLTILATENQL